MGTQEVNIVLQHSKAIGMPRFVLIALAHHTNHVTGLCNPSINTLARELRRSPRVIKRALDILTLPPQKELKRLTRGWSNGNQVRSSSYAILLPGMPPPPTDEGTRATPHPNRSGDVSGGMKCHLGRDEVTAATPKQHQQQHREQEENQIQADRVRGGVADADADRADRGRRQFEVMRIVDGLADQHYIRELARSNVPLDELREAVAITRANHHNIKGEPGAYLRTVLASMGYETKRKKGPTARRAARAS